MSKSYELSSGDREREPGQWRSFDDEVYIRITERGGRIYHRHYNGYAAPLRRDADGYTRMQLWKVAQIFGKHIYTDHSEEISAGGAGNRSEGEPLILPDFRFATPYDDPGLWRAPF